MKVEGTGSLIKNWKHWLVYSTCTFITIFVIVEFALSVSLFTMIAPSTFMFYFTPVGLILGETIVSFFASVLLFVGLFIILRFKVYVKTENGLKFNRSDAHLLLPFYLTAIVSLAIYISFIPLELSNIITYAIFILLFESLVEHSQVTRYGEHLSELFKKEPSPEYDKEKKIDAGQVEVIEEEEPVPPEEEIIPKKEEQVVKEPVEEEVELTVDEPVKEPAPKKPVVTKPVKVEKQVKKVKELEESRGIICPICGYEEEMGADSCSECGEPFEEEEEKDTFSELFEDIEQEFEEEPEEEERIEDEFEELEEEPEEEEKIEDKFEELEEELDEEEKIEDEFEELEEELEEEEKIEDEFEELEEESEEEETEEITEEDLEKELDEELRSLEEKTEFGEQVECPICGAKFDSTENSCPECGEPIHEGEEEDFFSELY